MKFRVASVIFTLAIMTGGAAIAGGHLAIGVGAGYVKPQDIEGTFYLNGHIRFPIAGNLSLEPEISYWNKSEGVEGLLAGAIKDTELGLNAIIELPSEALKVYAGAGAGAHFLKGSLTVIGIKAKDSETRLGIHLLGGIEYPIQDSFGVFATLRYDIVSDLSQLKLYGGIRLYLGS